MLSADIRRDRAVLRRHGHSFRLAGRLLGRTRFDRAAGLYAVCRTIDDLADEAADPVEARARLSAVRAALAGQGAECSLADRLGELRVDREAAVALVDTMLSDTGPVRIADEPALLRYAFGAAGTVGLMMCDVLDARDPRARQHAADLGIAMQLTNIARDVREDAERGRLYLPRSWLWDGVSPRDLLEADPQRVFPAVRRVLVLAERYYESGIAGFPYLDRRSRLAIALATVLYRAIGDGVLRSGPAFLSAPRIAVSRFRAVPLALRCLSGRASRDPESNRPVGVPSAREA